MSTATIAIFDGFHATSAADAQTRRCDVFVELNTRQNDGLTVSLEWDRDTGDTQVVVYDNRAAIEVAFGVPGAKAAGAFRHPFRYLPD
jgi:hypothetical protein